MDTEWAAMLLAGGRGTRLNLIASKRAKPAVPFAGTYRIIDFTLTNAMISGVRHVGVLTQYRPTSLMEHLGDGESWGLSGLNACLSILPPSLGREASDWYHGTADAVYQNMDFLRRINPKHTLILSGDHIYHMDYRPMLERHLASGADLTIAGMEVPWEDTSRFGVMVIDSNGYITRFVEKSPERVSNLANMGVYIFRTDVLMEELCAQVPKGGYDFGANVIPGLLPRRKVVCYRFNGYWRDVGTLVSYWSANMDALDPATGLDLSAWKTRTNLEGRGQVFQPPAWIGHKAITFGSIVSRGCRIEGTVIDSVLSPGVVVSRNARVVRSVIMHDCVIGEGAHVSNAILDKDVFIGPSVIIGREGYSEGANKAFPTHLSGGITVIGKGTRVPEKTIIGANVLIGPGLQEGLFTKGEFEDGETIYPDGI